MLCAWSVFRLRFWGLVVSIKYKFPFFLFFLFSLNISAKISSLTDSCTDIFENKMLEIKSLYLYDIDVQMLSGRGVGDSIFIETKTIWNDTQIGVSDILVVNDTLIVNGNLSFRTDAELVINPGAVCIIYGNLSLSNKVNLSIGAHLIVGGNLTATANSNKISVQIDSSAAVYVMGDVDSVNISGLNCPTPEEYIPYTGSAICNFGDIISMEDNENDSTGIYDLFVSGDVNKGVSPVYSELCGGEAVTIFALDTSGDFYQWCDSTGNHLVGGNSMNFITSVSGEYFVKIVTADAPTDTVVSYRAKVVVPSLDANFTFNNDICNLGEGSIIFSNAVGGSGFYEYSIDSGSTWQSSETFLNLNADTFDIRIRDSFSFGCESILDGAFILAGDEEPPIIDTCPLAVYSTLFDAILNVLDLVPITFSDNCSGLTDSIFPLSIDLSTVASVPVDLSAADYVGNSATCDFIFTVQSNTPITKNPDVNIVCAGVTIEFGFSDTWGSKSKWIVDGPDATIADQNRPTTEITFNAPGEYIIKAKIQESGQPTFYFDYITVLDGGGSVVVDVSISSSPSGAVCDQTEVTFTAMPTNGGNSPSYQWKIGDVNVDGETGGTFTTSTLSDGQVVSCEMASDIPCAINNPATSEGITMEVNPLPEIGGFK